MATSLDRIESTIKAAGFEARVWKVGSGRLLATPHAARLLACEIDGVEGDLFFHHPDLEDGAKARARFGGGGPIGGDRLWLAPEVGFMWEDLAEARVDPFKNYRVPAAMDPADWRILEDSAGHLRLTTEIALTDHRVKKRITVRADRRLSVTQPPDGLPTGLRGVSFSITNTLTLVEAMPGTVAACWDILQVPATGDLICPTVARVDPPRSYYAPFGDRHVKGEAGVVRFHIDAKRQIKMGLSPVQTLGRMGYLRKAGGVWTLIFRAFATLPGEPYVDLPRSSEETFGGDAIQAYNDNGGFGEFGEMECHDPAVVAGRNPVTRSGSSVTHVLAGEEKAVREAARMLLGVAV